MSPGAIPPPEVSPLSDHPSNRRGECKPKSRSGQLVWKAGQCLVHDAPHDRATSINRRIAEARSLAFSAAPLPLDPDPRSPQLDEIGRPGRPPSRSLVPYRRGTGSGWFRPP